MAALDGGDIKELVRARTDIVQLIGESLTLHSQRGGRLFVGLCPFHDDHNPSLQVNPERQTYRCWSCQEGGDCFSWVMKYENVGFREALVSLAQRAGVEVPQFVGRADGEGAQQKASLYEILAWAETEFHRFLLQAAQAERAREYLRSRNFTPETIAQYRLGYHPDSWEWIVDRARGKYRPEDLAAARLVKERDDGRGGYQDYFVDRVMFPIHDERGRCVAFGGRQLPDTRHAQGGKYFNSSESAVFVKSRLIFGLDRARDAIRKTETAVVMEGYVDCIKAHQAGVLNAVATLGTALTETHVAALKRFARRVVMVYDGDRAGRDASVRALEKFLAQEVDLRVLILPDELDPDEFLEAHGREALETLIAQAPEAWDFQLRNCLAQYGSQSVDARLRVLDEMLTLMTVVPNMAGSVRESVLVATVAQRLGMQEADARRRLRELRDRRAVSAASGRSSAGPTAASDAGAERRAAVVSLQQRPGKDDLLECELLQILFTDPHTIGEVRQEVGVDDLRNPALRDLLAVCFDLWDHGDAPAFDRVLTAVDCPHLKNLAVWLDERAVQHNLRALLADAGAPRDGEGSGGLLRQVLNGLKWRRTCASHDSAKGQLAGHSAPASGLNPEMKALLQQYAAFHQQRAAKKTQR